MKYIFIFFLFYSSLAFSENAIYVGPTVGSTSYNPSSGESAQSAVTYGAEAFYIYNKWIGGLNYSNYNLGVSGTGSVNVSQTNQWFEGQIKYKILDEVVSPFVFLGGGVLVQNITTQVLGDSESVQGNFFVKDIGVGLVTRFNEYLGLNFSAKYYQYSNTNGFNVALSLGYFPLL
jgi:hypothetical protein